MPISDRVVRVDSDYVFDLLYGPFRFGGRQIDLVQHRDDFDSQLDRRIAVGHGLRLYALGSVDYQYGALAGRQRAAYLVGEIDVPRRVDQVEKVRLTVLRPKPERGRLRLDRDPALALELHRIEHLGRHFAIGKATAHLDESISERRLAVVDVRDDRKIADVALRHHKKGCPRHPSGKRPLSYRKAVCQGRQIEEIVADFLLVGPD